MRTIQVTLARQYYKQVTINVEVEDSLEGEDLKDFLTEDEEINNKLEKEIAKSSFFGGDDEYTFTDEKNQFGGNL